MEEIGKHRDAAFLPSSRAALTHGDLTKLCCQLYLCLYRFVENLANLGSFIINYSAKPLVLEEGEYSLTTKFLVKLELNLPWKPVLAWPWGVLCEIDPETNLVTLHKESWDIEAWEV